MRPDPVQMKTKQTLEHKDSARSWHSGGNVVDFSDLLEDAIPPFPRLFDILGFERKPHSLGSGIGFVDRNVAPPNTTIVPKMMIFVVIIDLHHDFRGLFHAR
jgi:hypothetical protein